MSIHVFSADDKMANITLDVHTFIAQNLPKYRFQSSLDYTFISLSVSCDIYHDLDRKVANLFKPYILSKLKNKTIYMYD